MQRGELVLARHAVKARWPIPDEVRAELVKEAAQLMVASAEDRVRLGAMKVLIAADIVNIKDEQLTEARAERMALEAANGEADGDSSTQEGATPEGAGEPPPAAPGSAGPGPVPS